MKEIVVSGVRPTGNLHLGNYFGAVKNFVKMQDSYTCYFFVADYHSLTTHPKPEHIQQSARQVLAEYIACGLNPGKSVMYLQSDLPETAELYLLLNMGAYMGELEKVASFKEKVRTQPDNVNAGLLTYPVLMSADILLHRANKVPVGKDQEQHLEMTRNFAQRFNHRYGEEFFPLPVAYNFSEQLTKVPGLDGSGKMSKSAGENSAIFLADEPEVIHKKMMRAKTDTGPTQMNQPKSPEIQNLFDLLSLVSTTETVNHFGESYNNCTIRYGDLKKQLAEDMNLFIAPIRERILSLVADEKYIDEIAKLGAEKAHVTAHKTIRGVRELIGFRGVNF